MKNKVLSLMLALATVLSMPSFAFADKPVCPSIDAVKKVGLNVARPSLGGWFVMNLKNKYDTNIDWAFIIIAHKALDQAEAIKEGNAMLSLSTFAGGPTFNEKDKAWECGYIYV